MWRRRAETPEPTSVMAHWLMAMVRDDQAAMSRYRDDPDPERGFRILRAAFDVVVGNYFRSNHDVREISAFVHTMRARFNNADMFRQIDAEALIRSTLGDEVVTDDIDEAPRTRIQVMTFAEVVWQTPLSDPQVAALLAEAERQVR